MVVGLVVLLAGPLTAAPGVARGTPGVRHAVVFIYHRFGESRYPSTSTPVMAFRAQLDYLAARGFHVWPLAKLVNALRSGRRVPSRTVALTVDDAFQSFYIRAWPLIRAHGFPVTVFVSTVAVDHHYPAYMTWTEVHRLQRDGVAFADHTLTHPHMLERLPGETGTAWRSRITREIVGAQQRLREELGPRTNTDPRLFAYPYGEYDPAVAKIVTGLGYIAFSQASGALGEPLDPRALPRFPIDTHYDALSMFARRARSRPMPLARITPWNPLVGTENPPVLRLRLRQPLSGLACFLGNGKPLGVHRSSPDVFTIRSPVPLPVGRSLYTCTAPAGGGAYYWYTHLWIRLPSGLGY